MDRQPALTKLGFAVLGCNSVLAVYNSWGHPDSVAFVLGADAALALLFLCLCQFERDRGGAGARGRRVIKAAVWALTTLLTLMFASRVAPLMPPVVAAAVWTMAVATAPIFSRRHLALHSTGFLQPVQLLYIIMLFY
ncbi:hypothetical protein SEVIR_4G033800v4 [Setaria viridis]